MMSYKYDFELSSKRRTFLWLYQVLPIIDLIKEIYKLKEDSELEDIRSYHGLCPRHIKSTGTWIPQHINDNFKITNIRDVMKLNVLSMKLIQEEGLICSFVIDKSNYTKDELEEISYGNWISVVPNVNTSPTLQTKINVINLIYSSVLCLVEDLYINLTRLYHLYKNAHGINVYGIGCDQNNNLYMPFIHP
jgi:hypothetical protein